MIIYFSCCSSIKLHKSTLLYLCHLCKCEFASLSKTVCVLICVTADVCVSIHLYACMHTCRCVCSTCVSCFFVFFFSTNKTMIYLTTHQCIRYFPQQKIQKTHIWIVTNSQFPLGWFKQYYFSDACEPHHCCAQMTLKQSLECNIVIIQLLATEQNGYSKFIHVGGQLALNVLWVKNVLWVWSLLPWKYMVSDK